MEAGFGGPVGLQQRQAEGVEGGFRRMHRAAAGVGGNLRERLPPAFASGFEPVGLGQFRRQSQAIRVAWHQRDPALHAAFKDQRNPPEVLRRIPFHGQLVAGTAAPLVQRSALGAGDAVAQRLRRGAGAGNTGVFQFGQFQPDARQVTVAAQQELLKFGEMPLADLAR